MIDERMIVALDFDDLREAATMAYQLRDHVRMFKVGLEAWADPGVHDLIKTIKRQGSKVFLDLKLHDIPATVTRTVEKITSQHEIDLLTVLGYPKTLGAAVKAAKASGTGVISVNMLTSDTTEDMLAAGYTVTKEGIQGMRTDYVVTLDAAGIVCAAEDVKRVKSFTRGSKIIITPGMRLPGDSKDDQKRAATPSEAIRAGATHYVVGRPITRAADPISVVEAYQDNAR